MTIAEHIQKSPILKEAAAWSLQDGTLSSGEQRIARIVHALLDGADGLDSKHLFALAMTIKDYASEVESEELKAWEILERWGLKTI